MVCWDVARGRQACTADNFASAALLLGGARGAARLPASDGLDFRGGPSLGCLRSLRPAAVEQAAAGALRSTLQHERHRPAGFCLQAGPFDGVLLRHHQRSVPGCALQAGPRRQARALARKPHALSSGRRRAHGLRYRRHRPDHKEAVAGFFHALGFARPPFVIDENAMSPSEAAHVLRRTASRYAPFLAVADVSCLPVASRKLSMHIMSDLGS
mmetsp:Transcript_144893/g.463046  ORF Transcript_144893/g.463046 Transcript_144893/m.463046 type:complete len:213 (-) Transcript_144893:59-697(-)